MRKAGVYKELSVKAQTEAFVAGKVARARKVGGRS